MDDGTLLYMSPTRKVHRGDVDIIDVELSSPAKSRAINEIIPELGSGAFEISLLSIRAGRRLSLIFRNDEEIALFLYFLSLVSQKHNVPEFISRNNLDSIFADCQSIVSTHSKILNAAPISEGVSDDGALAYGLVEGMVSPSPRKSLQPVRKATPMSAAVVPERSADTMFTTLGNVEYSRADILSKLQSKIILGESLHSLSRAIWWRVSLGVLSTTDPSHWIEELSGQVHNYNLMKKEILPVLSDATADPLSAPGTISSPEGEWGKYYKV